MPARIDEDASFRMFDQVDRDRQSEPVFFLSKQPGGADHAAIVAATRQRGRHADLSRMPDVNRDVFHDDSSFPDVLMFP